MINIRLVALRRWRIKCRSRGASGTASPIISVTKSSTLRQAQEALEQSELSPRELAVRFTDEQRYFVSEASVYRLLKAHDLITS